MQTVFKNRTLEVATEAAVEDKNAVIAELKSIVASSKEIISKKD